MARGGEARRWEGRLLDGRYRVGEHLGGGGMGSVYLAEHVGLGQRRAVKFLHDDLARRPDAVKRFLREARVLASLRHEHIIEVADVGECEGVAYYVMELLVGEDLRMVLRRERTLPWARARRVALQVCDALIVAHASGVVHRDMKPENCFCVRRSDGDDFIKVLDFGIAKLLGGETQLTATGETLGTVSYMPPEQVEGGGDHRIDVYATGVMLYEMLAGRLPHEGTAVEVIAKLVRGVAPPRLGQVCAGLSDEIERVVMRAIATAPEARYPDVGALRAALAALPEHGPPRVVAPTPAPGGSEVVGRTTLGHLPTALPEELRPHVAEESAVERRGDMPAGEPSEPSRAGPDVSVRVPPTAVRTARPGQAPASVPDAPKGRRWIGAGGIVVLIVFAVWGGWYAWRASEQAAPPVALPVPERVVPASPAAPPASEEPGAARVDSQRSSAPEVREAAGPELPPEPAGTVREPGPEQAGGLDEPANGDGPLDPEKKPGALRTLNERAFKARLVRVLDNCRSTKADALVKVQVETKLERITGLQFIDATVLPPLKIDCVKTTLPALRSTPVAFTTRTLTVTLPKRS